MDNYPYDVQNDSFSNSSLQGGETEDLSTFMERVETYITYRTAKYINRYWFPILVPIGWVGNTLSFLVMIRPKNRKVSTCIYMAAISINDNVMICLALNGWLVTTGKLYEWPRWGCKSQAYLVTFSLQTSTFLVLAMTIDKYIAIEWPLKATTLSTSTRALSVALGVTVSALCYNVPHLFATDVVRHTCASYLHGGLKIKIYSWINFLVNFIIPFSLLIHMNYAIVKAVRNSRKMFRTNTDIAVSKKDQGLDRRRRTMKNTENQLTVMLLLVTVLFLILLFSAYIRFIYSTFVERDTPSKYASSLLMFEITHKLYNTNNGINFFLYCISGARFRNDLRKIMCCAGKSSNLSSVKTKCDQQTESTGASA